MTSRWCDELTRIAREVSPVTVVCRTPATVRAIYRDLAEGATPEHGGFAGLHVTTLAGLIHAAAPSALLDASTLDTSLPEWHPWKKLLASRPGLQRVLCAHVDRAHRFRAAGLPTIGLRHEILSLVDDGWGRVPAHEGIASLLGRKPRPGVILSVGFGSEPLVFGGAVSPVERTLLTHLGAREIAPCETAGAAGVPESFAVPDSAAEARFVALRAGGSGRVLVLVASQTTEERVRAALMRNGVAVADDGASPLTRHALSAVLRPLLPLFYSRGTAPLEARHLLRLLTDPVLARTSPSNAAVLPVTDGVDAPIASVRHTQDAITRCRLARAGLDTWLGALSSLEADAAGRHQAADPGDRDDATRWLASVRIVCQKVSRLAFHARATGKLGDVAALVTDIKLSDPVRDALGRAIARALADERAKPADEIAFDDALAGSLGSGRVDRGVEILRYHAYDGRGCDLLLLAEVHDKGLALPPTPDPLLTASDRRALALPDARDTVAERLGLVRWAMSRARESIAIVSATDASGRRVSPPVDLALRPRTDHVASSYGFAFDLAEAQERAAFGVGGARDPVTRQIDSEWARSGALVGGATAAVDGGDRVTLEDHLVANAQRFPVSLRPWLGDAGLIPGTLDGLPDSFVLSATRAAAFTQCLYRAFVRSVLRIKPHEEVTEEIDVAAVGTVVHEAMASVMKGVRLAVPAERVDATRADLAARLAVALPAAMSHVTADSPGETHAIRTARDGLTARWVRQLAVYAECRIVDVDRLNACTCKSMYAGIGEEPAFMELYETLAAGMAKDPSTKLRANLMAVCRRGPRTLAEFDGARDDLFVKIAHTHHARLESLLAKEAVRTQVQAVIDLVKALAPDVDKALCNVADDLEVVATELPFGRSAYGADETQAALSLPLGARPLLVNGEIDLVVHRRGPPGLVAGTRYRVIDFKTGSSPGPASRVIEELTQPQLMFYALAVEALPPIVSTHATPVQVESVAFDLLRYLEHPVMPVSREALVRANATIGALVDRARGGRYALVPHPDMCPLLNRHSANCDYAESCRLRPGFDPALATPAHDEEGEDNAEEVAS